MRSRMIPAALVLMALGAAQAQSRTYVKLAGKDDTLPKLGLPGITVEVFGPRVEESKAVEAELARGLAKNVHTRAVSPGERGDYALAVTLASGEGAAVGTIPFDAVLTSADGRKLWNIGGYVEVDPAGTSLQAVESLARNVVAALVHDGWVAPRYDPENPPPAPPTIRRTGPVAPR